MSNRRRLRPHEVARKDQALAEASELAAKGTAVIVVDYAEPGQPCCWCDCDAFIHDCRDPCTAEAEHVVTASWSPQRYPVCDRHQTGPLEVLAEFERDVLGRELLVTFGGSWMDE